MLHSLLVHNGKAAQQARTTVRKTIVAMDAKRKSFHLQVKPHSIISFFQSLNFFAHPFLHYLRVGHILRSTNRTLAENCVRTKKWNDKRNKLVTKDKQTKINANI